MARSGWEVGGTVQFGKPVPIQGGSFLQNMQKQLTPGLSQALEESSEEGKGLDPMLLPDLSEVKQVLVATELYQQLFKEHNALTLISLVGTSKREEPEVYVLTIERGGKFDVQKRKANEHIEGVGLKNKDWVGRLVNWLAKSPLFIMQVVRMLNWVVRENEILRGQVKELRDAQKADEEPE